MPDPLLYTKAFATTGIVSALIVLAIVRWADAKQVNRSLVCVPAFAVGLLLGFWGLGFRWSWPPFSAIDRLIVIVLPAAILVEWVAAMRRTPVWLGWGFRGLLAIAVPRILLHQSVYLSEAGEWSPLQAVLVMVASSCLLISVWAALCRLSNRSQEGLSIPLSLCMSIQVAGIAVMLAGYIKGGAVAIPLTAAILGTSLAATLVWKPLVGKGAVQVQSVIGFAVLSLFSVLFVGCFFGEIGLTMALVILMAPMLSWGSELFGFAADKPWRGALLRVTLVAIPLMIVCVISKREFDRTLGPLVQRQNSVMPTVRSAVAGAIHLQRSE
ncbi:hypothetical protein FF011L_24250 [Roseimaritima multifibrata]|uniref:Uncharacterized protein n=1 Tax=Roseimaritima multifibrata TaxID=1930274 RepID=A0A517MFI3_9BACT|nr:hypothetical protein [Roseimaritima multifibrata]QDS93652.1 hypothetical protein FF011L_24250 [Roseimaritima multifibrata]